MSRQFRVARAIAFVALAFAWVASVGATVVRYRATGAVDWLGLFDPLLFTVAAAFVFHRVARQERAGSA